MTTIDTTLIMPVAPVDVMNKNDLYEHLQKYHRQQIPYGLTSKSSKERLLDFHENVHQTVNYTEASSYLVTDENGGQRWQDNPNKPTQGEPQFVWSSECIHEHVVVPAGGTTQDEQTLLIKVQGGTLEKPLTSAECRSLEKVVNNDFAALKTEIRDIASSVLEERVKEVRADFAVKTKDAEKHRKALVKVVQDTNAKISKAIEDAKAAGVVLAGNAAIMSDSHVESVMKAAIAGQAEAEATVRQENNNDLNNALNTLERQRLAAQRMILLAGISVAGQALLATVPSAKTLMVQAAQERAERQTAKQIEA